MSKVKVTIDDSQIQAIFSALDAKKQKKTIMQGLRKSARILVRRTKQNLKKSVKYTGKVEKKKGWDKMESGIKIKPLNRAVEPSMGVNVMGEFRLRFFELGTSERDTHYKNGKLKKKYRSPLITKVKSLFNGKPKKKRIRQLKDKGPNYRGKITALHFFKKAKEDSEREVFSTIADNIKDSIRNAILKGKNRYV